MRLFEFNRKRKPVKVDYQLENGKIVIGKRRCSTAVMNLYGNIIEFLALVVIVMSVIGIIQYGTRICGLYLAGGAIIFYVGYTYKGIAREARERLLERERKG